MRCRIPTRPIPAVGRFDGGLSQLLRGDGHGHFTAVPPRESGLVVPGDAKALVVLDLDRDGWPDFLVSRNNDTTLAFRNHGVAGRKSVRVSLRGPAGNPTAIGAQDHRRTGGRLDADQRSVRRLRLLQPVHRRLFLWLSRGQSAARDPRALAVGCDDDASVSRGIGVGGAVGTVVLDDCSSVQRSMFIGNFGSRIGPGRYDH